MTEGRYRLVEVLRQLKVSDGHIRAALRSELGLTDEEADEALARDDSGIHDGIVEGPAQSDEP